MRDYGIHFTFRFVLAIVCFSTSSAFAQTRSGTLHTFDASYTNLEFVKIDGPSESSSFNDSNWIFRSSKSDTSFPLTKIIQWNSDAVFKASNSQAIVLTDGSILRGLITRWSKEGLQIQMQGVGLQNLPSSVVAGLVLKPLVFADLEIIRRWSLDSNQADDTVYLSDGTLVQGTIEGMIGDANLLAEGSRSIECRTAAGNTKLSLNRIAAVRFSPILNPIKLSSESSFVLSTEDGSNWSVESMGRNGSDSLKMALGSGVEVSIRDVESWWQKVCRVQSMMNSQSSFYVLKLADFQEIYGQTPWSRNRFLELAQRNLDLHIVGLDDADINSRIIAAPSFRAKLMPNGKWNRLVGTVRLRAMPSPNAMISDANGESVANEVESPRNDQTDLKIIAIQDRQVVELWKIESKDLSTEPIAISVPLQGQSVVYMILETRDSFGFRNDIIFEGLRYCNEAN